MFKVRNKKVYNKTVRPRKAQPIVIERIENKPNVLSTIKKLDEVMAVVNPIVIAPVDVTPEAITPKTIETKSILERYEGKTVDTENYGDKGRTGADESSGVIYAPYELPETVEIVEEEPKPKKPRKKAPKKEENNEE